ncbi:thiamine pyrophosphate-binding protein [Chelativorans salis]|uniref:Thiamine pyrophosphate-binding protein n=1 Tax=Chelativorans salis TaxID=2978478 RepID=A0ABT2LU28_9HYPH|nr:thiamine pyrophosphate-binding protein [Chelativorans sp. EGI FJ00035]MCT7378040.1 thiamine pyrophosphate-binding protein [Chelativorans sp. EGI FJ00035]
MTKKTYEVLAETFSREGVGTCFALLGDANMHWATELARLGTRMINVRHEHCAVSAAMSFSRSTGKVGVATVTCGPGLTQVLTALPAAVRANIPLVVFAGEAPVGTAWYNQAIDQAPFATATGAAYHTLHHPLRMPEAVRNAFVQAKEEQRPVIIGVPFDLQATAWSGGDRLPAPSADILPRPRPIPPHPQDVEDAAARISRAKRIVVMGGLGAVRAGAGPASRALAERLGALLATTLPARGLFHDDPFYVGVAGGFSSAVARACFAKADLVIAVGTRLAQHNLDKGTLFPEAAILQIDTHPRAVSQGQIAARHHLRADARLGIEALLEQIGPRDAGWRTGALARAISQTPFDTAEFPADAGRHDPRNVVAALDAALPKDWQMVNSSGHCSYYFAHMRGRPAERFTTIREFGAIGNGISYAMGVAAANPDDTVVLFDGDGSLLMHIQELETIRRHGLNILVCALNDGAYGSEIHKLRAEGLSDAGAVFGYSDLGAIARGFGVSGRVVKDLDALPEMVAEFSGTGGCAVWDFHVSDRIVSPVIRRAHPKGHEGTEKPIELEGLL